LTRCVAAVPYERRAAGIGVAQDPVPGEAGQRRLQALEDAADDVAEGYLGDRVPQLLEPAHDVDTRELQGHEQGEEPEDPRDDPDDPAPLRRPLRRCERRLLQGGLGHTRHFWPYARTGARVGSPIP
jgi:hypothetical protein